MYRDRATAVSLVPQAIKTYLLSQDFGSKEEAGKAFGCDTNPIEKRVLDCERDVRTVSRQSVVSVGPIAAGATITRQHLTIKRPGTGILAYRLDEVVGRVAARAIEGDVPIVEEDLA
jgi:sialic acid synthase SpsE